MTNEQAIEARRLMTKALYRGAGPGTAARDIEMQLHLAIGAIDTWDEHGPGSKSDYAARKLIGALMPTSHDNANCGYYRDAEAREYVERCERNDALFRRLWLWARGRLAL